MGRRWLGMKAMTEWKGNGNEGDEGKEGGEGNEWNEGDEGNKWNKGDEASLVDVRHEGNVEDEDNVEHEGKRSC